MEKGRYRNAPDSIITPRICNSSSIPFLYNITINILDEQVRCENAVHEVSPDVTIVKVVLE